MIVDCSELNGNWNGDRFMSNRQYLQMSFCLLDLDEDQERKQLTVNLRCGNEVIGPLAVTLLCDKFFVVTTAFGAFTGLIGTKSNIIDRIHCYKPFYRELKNGTFKQYEGWIRFTRERE